jgi:hypothetical protein
MPSFAYYISGHGFGHARRSTEIIRALLQRDLHLTVHVRTSAPQFIFDAIGDERVQPYWSAVDSGVVERDPLNPDVPSTLAGFRTLLDRAESLIQVESDFLKSRHATLVLADAPFLAGEVASRAGVPCIAVSNFTWDWILEPLVNSDADRQLLGAVRRAYSKMSGLVRLPFGHDNPQFGRIVDVPLVANRSRRERHDILARLEVSSDPRPRVLIGMRGGGSLDALRDAAAAGSHLLFINPHHVEVPLPDNVLSGNFSEVGLSFADLMSISDLVISKLGYGIVADCIAARTRLLWPRRNDFREDELTAAGSRRYIAHCELPTNDFYDGNWNRHIEALLARPMPTEHARLDGPEVAAKIIFDWR